MSSVDDFRRYSKEFRKKLGFTNQQELKKYFGAKDIVPCVDYIYMDLLNKRLFDFIKKLENVIPKEISIGDVDAFYASEVEENFNLIKESKAIDKLTNQNRRKEEVYFAWMKGLITLAFFRKSLAYIFDIAEDEIKIIGDDDLTSYETFRRTPKADLQITLNDGEFLRIEIQSGFQGTNDIKFHKYREAQRLKDEKDISTLLIHFDLFNGLVAFIMLNDIEGDDQQWITRTQMEGQLVFNIDLSYFTWKLTEMPAKYKELIEY